MKLSTLTLLMAVAGLAGAGSAMAATLVQDVKVFDGQRMLGKRSVLIDGATIVDADFKGPAPQGATVVSGAGRTLMPGLIDSHVHAFRTLELPLLFGVTTQVDMFTGVQQMQEATKRMQEGKNSNQADLFSAGTLATAPGGHGTQYGMPIPTLTKPEEAQAFVDARLAEGSHFIKIVMEEGVAGRVTPSLDVPTMAALIKAAHLRGKLAVVHVSSLKHARAALEAGADGLVHLFMGTDLSAGDSATLIRLAKTHKSFVIPTFSVLESMSGVRPDDVLSDASLMAYLTREQAESLNTLYVSKPASNRLNAPKSLTEAMTRAGVPVLAGTDAGNAGTQYGISMHHEMAVLVDAGMTPQQAMAAATSEPARLFRLGQRGRIAKGYKADLLLVEGDPSHDIGHTRRIVTVWKDGVDAAPLRAQQLALVEEQKNPKAQVALALPADGRISWFSKDKLGSPIGFGWMPANDGFMGGKSTVALKLKAPEAGQPVLGVTARVAEGFAYPWAGLAFMPGTQPMAAADLSNAKVIRFKVRGDGNEYRINVMTKSSQVPASVAFVAESKWTEVAVPFASFKGVDPTMITMIAFNAGPKLGDYAFDISDVRLAKE